jgi:hypothetical protein
MAEAVAAFAAAVAAKVTAVAAQLVVTSLAASQAIYAVAFYGTQALVYAGVSIGSAMLAAPSIPKPESFATTYRSGRSPRVSAYGRNRLSGPAMLYEATRYCYDVLAIHDGQIEAIEAYWLHDDQVTLDSNKYVIGYDGGTDPRYRNLITRVFTRLGLPTETSYTTNIDFSELGAGVWTSAHRGDGIASVLMWAKGVEGKDMPTRFPNGAPQASVTARCLRVYDWRDTGNDDDDPDTWECKFNPILQLADYLTNDNHGMGFSFAERIAPALSVWSAAADVCDEAVSLKAGGTEPRYQSHGPFQHVTAPIDVITRILETCDGWLAQRGDGAFIVRAGEYYEPDVTFTDAHITDYTLQRFMEDEQAVNVLIVSYTSPVHKFQEVETDPWRDESDILARGIERFQDVAFTWVQNNGQARRLAKRRMSRLAAEMRGTFTTNLYGLKALGERYVRVQISEISALNDVVVEIVGAELDLSSMRIVFSWIVADENIDAWNPATEEGDGPATATRTAVVALVAPTIEDVTPFFESAGTGGEGVRLALDVAGPDREDLTWFVRWRVDGGVSWNEAQYTSVVWGTSIQLETGFVTANDDLEVEAAYSIGSGDISPWSATFDVNTSTDNVAPASPTNVQADPSGSPPDVIVSWRNPTSVNFDHARVYRNTTATFGTATDISGAVNGSPGENVEYQDAPGSGTFYYWVTAENAADTDSPPAGPDSITV